MIAFVFLDCFDEYAHFVAYGFGYLGFSGTGATATTIAATTLYRGCCYFRTRIPRLQLRVETQGLPILRKQQRNRLSFRVQG